MMKLIIPGWNEHFENNRSRAYDHLRWVPMPNKHDGEGYAELLIGDPAGLEDFACWILIVQVASKCTPRGELLKSDGTPHTCKSLSLKTRAPACAFAHAIPRLCMIGWLTDLQPPAEIPQGAAEIEQAAALNRIEKNRKNRIEKKGTAVPDGYPEWFEDLWKFYPRKIGKKAAYETCKTRVKQGVVEVDLIMASGNYATAMAGREMSHIKHATTFYGPKDWWTDYKEKVPDGDAAPSNAQSSDEIKQAFKDAPWNKEPEDD